ncbi:MAG: hypothetical protein U0798_20840 [Gemmataceae bacterium]
MSTPTHETPPISTAPSAAVATPQKGKRPRQPEKKFGPFAGGVGVAVWLNAVDDPDGNRYFRSITINPRRYRDKETGQWLDGSSFKLTDLPALILALEAAHQYSLKTTLPGLPADDEEFGQFRVISVLIPSPGLPLLR